MKRIMILTMAALTLTLSSGCQPAPYKASAAEEYSARLIETSLQESTDSQSLRGRCSAPERYEFESKSKSGKLKLNVDARVVVPDKDSIPVYRVKAADFTQAQVDGVRDVLMGDVELWQPPQYLPRKEYEDALVTLKQQAEIEEDEDELFNLKAVIADIEKVVTVAPETAEPIKDDGKLKEIGLYSDFANVERIASRTGLDVSDKSGKQIQVYNNSDLKEPFIGYDKKGDVNKSFPVTRNASLWFADNSDPVSRINFGFTPVLPLFEDSTLTQKQLANAKLTPAEVKRMVQDKLDKANSGMVVDSIYLLDDEQLGYVDDEVRPAKNYAYKVYCVRQVDGIPCASIPLQSTVDPSDDYSPSWGYEHMVLKVNANGIFDLNWASPIEISGTENTATQLKPFNEVTEVFERAMKVKYEAASEDNKLMEFTINRLTLSLQRIADNGSYENGLLVPAWNFYGKQLSKHNDGGYHEEYGDSFLSINAIDGSVIDTEKGY